MKDSQADFLQEYLDFINEKYPIRFMEGVRKYGTVLHEDNTALELVDEGLEELMDAVAYSLAAKHQIKLLLKEISDLKDIIKELEK